MVAKKDFRRIGRYIFEIPADYRPDMRVPARIYADDELLEAALSDRSVEQLINTAALPGVVRYTLALPDIHQGYGPPIGGVIATKHPQGVISPGAVGYDINCGVRLLVSNLEAAAVAPHMESLIGALFRDVPSGLGERGPIRLSHNQVDQVLKKGAAWAVAQGYGSQDDLIRCEEQGGMPGADPEALSSRAKDRGASQLGTLGSGNHFLEIQEVTEVYDQEVAQAFGLFQGQLAVQIHSGSRGLGHQVCTDYVKSLQAAVQKYGIQLPDRELVCAPLDTPEGRAYFGAMAGAANYAWANRQCLAHLVRQTFDRELAGKFKDRELRMVYDVAHNIAKLEEHEVDGKRMHLCVHRKGATRAFPPGHPSVPEPYRAVGQPVLVPGDMGTASYVLVGTERALEETFGTSCHGAGRVLSRAAAKKRIRGEKLREDLRAQGIYVRAGSMPGLAEEAPDAYKDIERVVNVVHELGIARKVARLRPLAVMKG
ncbi:MAG: RtcB family protein [Anaerolineae bacterium]